MIIGANKNIIGNLTDEESSKTIYSRLRTAIGGTEGACPIISSGTFANDLIPANSRISAALSNGNATTDTLDVKLHYHTY